MNPVRIVTIDVPELGNRTHLVHDGRQGLVIDPPRDLAAVERAATAAEIDIVAVADTHVHNDYVSGALGLARRHGADYLLAADETVEFERVGVRAGDVVPVGALSVDVLATPGHTRHHQSFLVRAEGGAPGALFSGGSLLHGTVGRTDLLDPRLTVELARAQWASARAQAQLPDPTLLLPTHGFGSFCAGTAVVGATDPSHLPTVGDQRGQAVLVEDQERFVAALVAGFGPYPRYYAQMGALNRAGAGRTPGTASVTVLSAAQLGPAVAAGGWVVDLRDRRDYAAGHLPGAIGVEYCHQFATYVGWVVPWGTPVVLVGDRADVLETAVRDLAAIGIERVSVHVLDAPAPAAYRVASWAEFSPAADRVVLDVRQRAEYAEGHLVGALNIPVQDVAGALAEIPAGEVWVHCKSGFRAEVAASLLAREGRRVVHVDDGWEHAEEQHRLATVSV